MRQAQCALAAAVIAACLAADGAASPSSDPVLRAFGTATVDGVLAPGEWDGAAHVEANVARSPDEGGGVVPATMYVMNDALNLYIGLKVMDLSVAESSLYASFDANNDRNYSQEGEDGLQVDSAGNFYDRFVHQTSQVLRTVYDHNYGGTDDGSERDGDNPGGFAFFELEHPLNDADNAHDFSLSAANRIGFRFTFQHCAPNCTNGSALPTVDIVVVSGSRVPPDTQISAGPAEGSVSGHSDFQVEFAGTDDAIPPSALTFECQIDGLAWSACVSPRLDAVGDGRHTFSVRATDEMLNVDPTPAQRTWAVDRTGPSTPVIRGPRSVRKGVLTVRFSSRDEFTPTSRIRYKCALDSKRLKSCPAVFRKRVRPGRHVLRVRAVDSVGNQSVTATFRITVKRTAKKTR